MVDEELIGGRLMYIGGRVLKGRGRTHTSEIVMTGMAELECASLLRPSRIALPIYLAS